jgi:uncharacterized membrane protein
MKKLVILIILLALLLVSAAANWQGSIILGINVYTYLFFGDYVLYSGRELEVEVLKSGGALTCDLLEVTGTVTLQSGSIIYVIDLSTTEDINTGDTFTIITAGGGITDNGAIVRHYSPTLSFVGSVVGNDYILIATRTTAPVYEIIDLGALPGKDKSEAFSINDSGQIVGISYDYSTIPNRRATLFDSTGDGNNIDLGTLGNGISYSYAMSINNNGKIVGYVVDSSVNYRPCIFDPSGSGVNTDLITGNGEGIANFINNNGQIVGWANRSACSFDSSGGGANQPLDGEYAYSINDIGQIVGYFSVSSGAPPHSLKDRACIFDPSGSGRTDLGLLASYPHSKAISNNNWGQIVGLAAEEPEPYTDYDLVYRACLFDSSGDGNNIDLGTLGGDYSQANYINDLGQIVGWANPRSSLDLRACLFDSSGGGDNTDLNMLINPSSGWTLKVARCINNNGWIVGYGTYRYRTRAFLLKPANTAPVAIAGPNQVVYVCDEDELAEVTLDGSSSYDDDGDELDYYWSWFIESNYYEANGVSPTIQLPVGEHEITLVVDDGIDESEPSYCTITVEGPLHAKLLCRPWFLNTQSRGGNIIAFVYMPAEILPEDIDANEPLIFMPGGVESTRQFVFQWRRHGQPCTWIIASFDKGDCMVHLLPRMNDIKVIGSLNSGQCYYGNSRIYVFTPRRFWRPRRF